MPTRSEPSPSRRAGVHFASVGANKKRGGILQTASPEPKFPQQIINPPGRRKRKPLDVSIVGAVLLDDYCIADLEVELHIIDCERLWKAAYARFQTLGDPKDRDEAFEHLHAMNAAVLTRSAAVQAEAHAAFERRLDEGVDYFGACGARDRAKLERQGANGR